jgi:hypothetical protein
METFYSGLASICFTLVGLWWVVVQFKYEWSTASPARRLTAYAASMHFIAPGLLSLVAVLVTEEATIWRLGSALGGALGVIMCALSIRSAFLDRAQRIQEWALLALFAIVFVLTFVTTPVLGLKPIMVEALVNVAIVAFGVQFAWQAFVSNAGRPTG